jgi:F-type H+-transporting ATPase subunit b
MAIDLWGLGLQAINFLVLVWLLSRVFWRPVAAAITRRQETAAAVLETARSTQARADAALQEAEQARADIATQRTALLDHAAQEARAATEAALKAAKAEAKDILAAAQTTVAQEAEAARKASAQEASDLSLTIAGHLLGRLDGPAPRAAFLAQLTRAIADLPDRQRADLAASGGIEIITATDATPDHDAITIAVHAALGTTPDLRFATDPDLIGGIELRSPHLVIHNSWQADLAQIRRAVADDR